MIKPALPKNDAEESAAASPIRKNESLLTKKPVKVAVIAAWPQIASPYCHTTHRSVASGVLISLPATKIIPALTASAQVLSAYMAVS